MPDRRSAGGLLPLLLLAACAEAPTGVPDPATVPVAAAVTASSVTTVMAGLNAPRGMAWGPEGGLYVAEAGTPVVTGPCAAVARGPNCYSGTGSVSRLWRGMQERVVEGLPSAYNAAVFDIIGPNDIDFQGRGGGFVTIGWGGDPGARSQLGALGAAFGHLLSVQPGGPWRPVGDVSAYESAHNPAGGPVDSNPFGTLAEAGVRYVADAGGNALLALHPDGAVSQMAVFAPLVVPPPFNGTFPQADPVPTEVKRGPDGALYVSTLSGVPFVPGSAGIYRVVPGAAPQPWAMGFTQVTDFDFAPDGTIWVVQYAAGPFLSGQGSLVHVATNGVRTVVHDDLTHPTAVLAGPDGAVYVTVNGNLAGVGAVLRIVP